MRTRRNKGIVELYGYYEHDIDKLAELLFSAEELTVKSLKIPSGHIQAAYKEMKEISFKGSIFDYLSWINYRFWLWETNKRGKKITRMLPATLPHILFRTHLLFDCPEFDDYAKGQNRLATEKDFISQIMNYLADTIMVIRKAQKDIDNAMLAHG